MGVLVIESRDSDTSPVKPLRIGHVVGLQLNNVGETIPLIQWAFPHAAQGFTWNPSPVACHHNNLERYVGQRTT